MTEETFCKTCGAFDSYVCNGDNGGCSECYDTENIIFSDEQNYEQIIEEKK